MKSIARLAYLHAATGIFLVLMILTESPAAAQSSQTATAPAPEGSVTLFDFESDAELADWSPLAPEAKEDRPAPKIERVAEGATAGKSAMKLTFEGGSFPGVQTRKLTLADWKPPLKTFSADVTAQRPCVVFFRALTEKAADPKNEYALYVKVARLDKGPNHVEDLLFPTGYGRYGSLGANLGKIVSFEIILYSAEKGDSILVDNIRLSTEQPKTATPFVQRTVTYLGETIKDYPWAGGLGGKIKVLGTGEEFANVVELARTRKDQWVEPKELTIDEVEAAFRKKHQELKGDHPQAVLAILRDGEKGFNPQKPEEVYAGWKDAYIWAPEPASIYMSTFSRQTGKDTTIEYAFRTRCPLMQVDLASIPKGSKILAAQLVLTRIVPPKKEDLKGPYASNSPFKPTFFSVEPCRRPWEENEVNCLEYAKGKYWNAPGGMSWSGKDPDFLPLVAACGPAGLTITTIDFTQAVAMWTSGKEPNCGFAIYPVQEFLAFGRFWSREIKDVKLRPCVMVIYEPASK